MTERLDPIAVRDSISNLRRQPQRARTKNLQNRPSYARGLSRRIRILRSLKRHGAPLTTAAPPPYPSRPSPSRAAPVARTSGQGLDIAQQPSTDGRCCRTGQDRETGLHQKTARNDPPG